VRKLEEAGKAFTRLVSSSHRSGEPIQYWLHSDETYRHELKDGFVHFMKVFDQFREDETQFQNSHSDQQKRSQANLVLWSFVVLNFAVAWGLSTWFSKRITGRLSVLRENNIRLSRRQPLHGLVAGNDEITELDKGFHHMAELLLKAERQKQEFVQMISHDLRTPLSAIQGTLALALRGSYGSLNDKGKSRLSDAEQDSERLIAMINELLDIEKIEAGKLQIDFADVSLEGVISRSIESVAPLAQSNNVELRYDGADATVRGDFDRLIRVAINLISNAIKYSPTGTTVTISVESTATAANVRVADCGRGIPVNKIDTIFDRFSQVENADAQKGTGLGLAICKAIIEAHSGTIGVESKEGCGSTFWFSLRSTAPATSAEQLPRSENEHVELAG
jgi:signal transduction histidine kinase